MRKSNEVEIGEGGIVRLRREEKMYKIDVLESLRAHLLGKFNRIMAAD